MGTAVQSKLEASPSPSLWSVILLTAMASGMGWGIRGQYGHETGAMIAGLLVGLVLVFRFCPQAASLPAARAVAWCTIGISFGGSMTYGQTVGLTHDPSLVGNWAALRWGMLGLAIKGGIWIGFAGVFLGMALSGFRYRLVELAALLAAMLPLLFLGFHLFNQPFDPVNKVLPRFYFSADWRWQPGAELKPRREYWGGLLLALVGVIAYAGWIRRDRLARNLALWAILGGALGFPLGQSLQAFHAWNRDLFRQAWLAGFDQHINWWNMMETTFGATFGAVLAIGLWLNRKLIVAHREPVAVTIPPRVEWVLALIYVLALTSSEFFPVPWLEPITNLWLIMGIVPIIAVAGGRYWPYLLALPITVLPIAGKTLAQLGYKEQIISAPWGWLLYVIIPLGLTTVVAIWFAQRAVHGQSGRVFTRGALLLATWLYFGLNYAFFHFPWPWSIWTSRTPNAIIFTVCALGLTLAAVLSRQARVTNHRTQK